MGHLRDVLHCYCRGEFHYAEHYYADYSGAEHYFPGCHYDAAAILNVIMPHYTFCLTATQSLLSH